MSDSKATLKVEPVTEGEYTREELEALTDQDMKDFSTFFSEQLGNSPPTDFENYFLKTYLLYKLGVQLANSQST